MEHYATIAIGCFIASVLGTWLAIGWLQKLEVLDKPNERSNHVVPVPRGGGLVIMAVFFCAAFLLPLMTDVYTIFVSPILLSATFLLAVVSWHDDRKSIPAQWRFLVQIIAVSMGGIALSQGNTFQGLLPDQLDTVLTALAWLWFINLFNFMDGIDGITGAETLAICSGIIVVGSMMHLPDFFLITSVIIATTTAGFLLWNWHPAKIFMGDVGSIPLGFLLGWLLIELARHGYWAAALILPGYYLADSTITLLKRLFAGKKIWQAHSEHYYQQAVRNGRPHHSVVKMISAENIFLLLLAAIVSIQPSYIWIGLALAFLFIAVLLYRLKTAEKS